MSPCVAEFAKGLFAGGGIVAILALLVWMLRTQPYDTTKTALNDPDEVVE